MWHYGCSLYRGVARSVSVGASLASGEAKEGDMHSRHGGLLVARPRLDGGLVTEFRRLLGEARGRFLRTVAMTDDELQGLSAPEPGFNEEAARRAGAQLLAWLEGRERREIDEIEAATARIATGVF